MKNTKTKLLLAFFISGFFLFGLAGVSEAAILFYEDFEDGLKITDEWRLSGKHGSQGLTTEQVRHGSKSYKFSLTRYDSGDYREELVLWARFNNGSYKFTIGDEYWIGFSVFLADGYPENDGAKIHHQYHAIPDKPPTCVPDEDSRNPVVAIQTKGKNWQYACRSDASQCTSHGNYDTTHFTNYGAFSTGQWLDYVINVKWGYGGNGFIKIWENGVLKIDLTGGNCFNDDIGPYLKIGIYTFALDQDQTITIYYDELKIGDASSSYAEVSPGGAPPPPPPTCASQSGTCCSPLQICQGGSFVSSSDCGANCCAGGGTCQDAEICNDLVDNDGDGDIDCADADCIADPACVGPPPPPPPLTCQNQGYQCCAFCQSGPHPVYDGDCALGRVCCEVCTPFIPPPPPPCADTCISLVYECGTFNVCGVPTNCGVCIAPQICGASGMCYEPPPPPVCTTEGLVPCGRNCDDPATAWIESDDCNLCFLILMGQLTIEFLVKLSGIIALLIIAAGGLMHALAAGNQGAMEKAKSTIKYTMNGFIVIFIVWAVVNSILIMFGYIDPLGGEWYMMDC